MFVFQFLLYVVVVASSLFLFWLRFNNSSNIVCVVRSIIFNIIEIEDRGHNELAVKKGKQEE